MDALTIILFGLIMIFLALILQCVDTIQSEIEDIKSYYAFIYNKEVIEKNEKRN